MGVDLNSNCRYIGFVYGAELYQDSLFIYLDNYAPTRLALCGSGRKGAVSIATVRRARAAHVHSKREQLLNKRNVPWELDWQSRQVSWIDPVGAEHTGHVQGPCWLREGRMELSLNCFEPELRRQLLAGELALLVDGSLMQKPYCYCPKLPWRH